MQENQNKTMYTLFDKTTDLEPTGLIYNLRGSMIENYVYEYLKKQGVTGVEAVSFKVKRDGSTNPDAVLYLFLSSDSSAINISNSKIPANLRHKIEEINVNLTKEFEKIIAPLAGKDFILGRHDSGICYIHLNLFAVLALMFACDRNKHQIVIADIKKIPEDKDSILSIIKQYRYTGGKNTNQKTVRFDRIIDDIEYRDKY